MRLFIEYFLLSSVLRDASTDENEREQIKFTDNLSKSKIDGGSIGVTYIGFSYVSSVIEKIYLGN